MAWQAATIHSHCNSVDYFDFSISGQQSPFPRSFGGCSVFRPVLVIVYHVRQAFLPPVGATTM